MSRPCSFIDLLKLAVTDVSPPRAIDPNLEIDLALWHIAQRGWRCLSESSPAIVRNIGSTNHIDYEDLVISVRGGSETRLGDEAAAGQI